MTQDLRKAGWEPLLERLDADLARAEAGADPEQRDEQAWAELHRRVDHYARMVARKRRRRTGRDPWLPEDEWEREDIAQEVCVKLHARDVLAKVRRARQPAGYLVGMLRNAEADRLRREGQRRVVLTPEDLQRLPETSSAVLGDAAEAALNIGEDAARGLLALGPVLEQLSREERHLLHKRYTRGRSVAEIAAELGVSYSAAAVRLHRLRERVRALMKTESPGWPLDES